MFMVLSNPSNHPNFGPKSHLNSTKAPSHVRIGCLPWMDERRGEDKWSPPLKRCPFWEDIVTLGNFPDWMRFFSDILAKKNGKKVGKLLQMVHKTRFLWEVLGLCLLFLIKPLKSKIVKMHCKSACVFLTNNSQGRRRK